MATDPPHLPYFGLGLADWKRVVDWGLPDDWQEWTAQEKVSWAIMLRELDDE